MSHADTLRTWAKQYITPAAREPFLAGADALEAIDRVRHALILLEEKWAEANEEWHGKFDMYEQGRSDAYGHAHTLITEALGDTPCPRTSTAPLK